MTNKLTNSLILTVFIIIILFSSCASMPPPELVVNTPEGELRIKGTTDFPETGSELDGYYFHLPSQLPSEYGNMFIKLIIPSGWNEYIELHTNEGNWEEVQKYDETDQPRTLLMTSVNISDLRGIAFSKREDLPLPSLELISDTFHVKSDSEEGMEGITFLNSESGVWDLELDTRQWSSRLKNTPWYLKVSYSCKINSVSPLESRLIITTGESETRNLDFFPKSGENALYFFGEEYGIFPKKLSFYSSPDFSLTGISIVLEDESVAGSRPIIADTGTILHYPPEKWRNPDYEYFLWNLYPEIVQITTRNYDIQSRFFKRLAFYVEKPGFVGRLAPNDEIESLHGWNAHDYCPEDLARFFQQIKAENFVMNPEEKLLKRLLLENNIIIEQKESYIPGTGALIGTSLETFYEQRLIFMAHESFHGIYFTSPEYREECRLFWESLSGDEQKFWENFLSYRGYNVEDDHDLLINETATYLLQQPSHQADDYFIGFITPRLLNSRTWLAEWLIPFLRENPGVFRREVMEMETRLFNLEGFTSETVHDLLPADRSKWEIFNGLKDKWYDTLDD